MSGAFDSLSFLCTVFQSMSIHTISLTHSSLCISDHGDTEHPVSVAHQPSTRKPTLWAYSKPRSRVTREQSSRAAEYECGSVLRVPQLRYYSRWRNSVQITSVWMYLRHACFSTRLHHNFASNCVTKLKVQLGPATHSCSPFRLLWKEYHQFLMQKRFFAVGHLCSCY